ncbi:MAG: SdpI family protein [Acutalibacteraceae bacterium]
MIKKNKAKIIITSLLTVLPIAAGLILWNRLPEKIPTHFNIAGEPDGTSGKAFAVFGIPLFLLAVHLFCVYMTSVDPKKKNISEKAFGAVLWLCPAISVLISEITYSFALGAEFSVNKAFMLFFSAIFIILGNYMPKCKQNYSFGIRISWTLNSVENWNKTHRFAGRLWVAGGVLLAVISLIKANFIIFSAFLAVMVAAPMIYSFAYYKKHIEEKN